MTPVPVIEARGLRKTYGGAVALDEGVARGHAELHARDARAVLAAVVLLLHEEEQLIKSVQRGSVFLNEIRNRFAKADESHATLVLDEIAHELVRGR